MGINSPLPVSLPDECKKAAKIIRSFVDSANNGLDKVIPRNVMERAHGFAVFTVLKAGFLFSARAGSGLVIAKLEDGSWSAPSAIGLGGFGFGGQLGAEVTDFLIVLNSRTAVRTFMAAGSMTLGGNLSVAVGPLGRNAEGSGSLSTKGKTAALYSYSKTKGLFGGVSVEGSIIVERQDANRIAYGSAPGENGPSSKEILSGFVDKPEWARNLVEVLEFCTGMPGGREWVDDRPGEGRYGGAAEGEGGSDDEYGGGYGGGYGGSGRGNDSPKKGNRSRSGSGASGGGGYTFGQDGVGSFSSTPPGSPGRPGKNRSRSSSLKNVLSMDLMGNSSPKAGRSRGNSILNPATDRSGGGGGMGSPKFNLFSKKPTPGQMGSEYQAERDPFEGRLSEDSQEGRSSMESNPFDAPDEKLAKPKTGGRNRNLLDLDLDLGNEVVSPWNNDKGLSTTPRGSTSHLPSSPGAFPVNFDDGAEYPTVGGYAGGAGKNGRERSASNVTLGNRRRAGSGGGNDLLGWGAGQQDASYSPSYGEERPQTRSRGASYSGYDDNPSRFVPAKSSPMKPTRPLMGRKTSSGKFASFNKSFKDLAVGGFGKNGGGGKEGDMYHTPPGQHSEAFDRDRGREDEYDFDDGRLDHSFDPNPVVRDEYKADKERFRAAISGGGGKAPAVVMADGQRRAVGLFDFQKGESGDLGFRKGEVVVVLKGEKGVDEWWTGRNAAGEEGIFPANYVELR